MNFFQKAINKIQEKYWKDSVWSNVIAGVILALVFFLFGIIKAIFDTFTKSISFPKAFGRLFDWLASNSQINNFVLISLATCFLLFVFNIFYHFVKKRQIEVEISQEEIVYENLPYLHGNSAVLFSNRISNAFPGQRGIKWYEPKVAVERLKIVFQEPLIFKVPNENLLNSTSEPIWWFRGMGSLSINNFKVLSRTKILIGYIEVELKNIAVNVSNSYYRHFIYVEAKAERPTGLYHYSDEDLKREKKDNGYSYEYYGLLGKRPITQAHLDDGATIIKGKVVDARGAELRKRFLTDCNFIICSHESPINSKKYDIVLEDFLNDILKRKRTANELFSFIETFKKND